MNVLKFTIAFFLLFPALRAMAKKNKAVLDGAHGSEAGTFIKTEQLSLLR